MRNPARNAMRSVKVNKFELLGILASNRETHVTTYEEAVVDYKTAALKIAQDNLELAKTTDLDKISKMKAVPSAPVSYADNYDRAIRMLQLSVDDVIELEEDIFNQLVLDEWNWKHQFTVSASLYKTLTV